MNEQFTRRSLLKTGAAGVATWAAGRCAGPALGVRGANERIRLAIAGIHGMGKHHIHMFGRMKNVEIVALVDPDSRLFDDRTRYAEEVSEGRSKPACVQDVRRVLDDQTLDCLSVVTPNHWHCLMTIWACQAGKDVYVEKPLSHNWHEGRLAVQAARKYGRIVQVGTIYRSEPDKRKAAEVVRSGQLGKLHLARAVVYVQRDNIGFQPTTTPPPKLDFELWQGPAPGLQYHGNLVHYNWHWFWATGNGETGNLGVHQMDIARRAMPGATLPKRVVSLGGRFGREDQGQTPNTVVATLDFGETQMLLEVRGLAGPNYRGMKAGRGNIYHLDTGTIINDEFIPEGEREPRPLPDIDLQMGPGTGSYENFLAAVRSRKVSDLNADILQGHYSTCLCHLINISYRLGKQVSLSPQVKSFEHHKEAHDASERMVEHLRENGIILEDTIGRLGRPLKVDAATETIVDDEQAEAMRTGRYREGYALPDRI